MDPFKVAKSVKTGYKAYKAVKVTKAASTAKKTTVVAKVVTKKPKPLTTIVKTLAKSAKPKNVKKQSAALKKVTKKTKNIGCFTKGTKVSTKNGFKAIDQIKVGDHVWSENPETNEKALKKVKKIFVREKDSIIRLSINGETIKTTDEYPFYKEGYGFVPAKSLEVGDRVRLEGSDSGIVESTETIHLDKPIKVYNFEVEDYHTYYVSEAKVLVHNTCALTLKNAPKAKSVEIDASKIRFSQTSVNDAAEIIASMKKSGWKGDAIDVVRMTDGKLTTLDNTRVLAARNTGTKVKANIHMYDEVLPEGTIRRFTTPKGVPRTWGDAVNLRIGKQNATYRKKYPNGSDITGWRGN